MSKCEAGTEISETLQCYKCGAFPSETCRGMKPPDARDIRIKELAEHIALITNQLRNYKEREAVTGWNKD